MIEILPMKNKHRVAELLGEAAGNNTAVLQMTEGETELGFVSVQLVDTTLRMLTFHTIEASEPETAFYLDTLMRAAASYGETKGADYLETVSAEYNAFLSKKGFTTDETHAFAPMSLIVHYE